MVSELEITRAFVAEGGDNSFKSTMMASAGDVLEGLGVQRVQIDMTPGEPLRDLPQDVPILLESKEPGGSIPGVLIRRILLESSYSGELNPAAYVNGYYFDRSILYGIWESVLREYKNAIIIDDRSDWTTMTMQLNDARRRGVLDLMPIRQALLSQRQNMLVLMGGVPREHIFPEIADTLLFDAPAAETVIRAEMGGKPTQSNWRDNEQFEGTDFIRQEYLELVRTNGSRACVFNTMLPPEALLLNVVDAITSVLPPHLLEQISTEKVPEIITQVTKQRGLSDKWNLYMASRDEEGCPSVDKIQEQVYLDWLGHNIERSGLAIEP